MYDDKALIIYTDGSSKVHMGCKAGCAFVVLFPEYTGISDVEEVDYSYRISKIGAMEIEGINWALQWIGDNSRRLRDLGIAKVIIYCDNQYVVDSANSYIYSWIKNKWKKLDGGDIANISAWKRFASLKRKWNGISFEIKWIPGKKTEITKKVDRLAKESADSISRYSTSDYMHGRYADRLDSSILFKETYDKQHAIIRVYYHQAVNKTKKSECKVYFEVIDKGKVKQSCIAYCSREFDFKFIDRKNYYKANFKIINKHRIIFDSVEKITGDELENLKKSVKKVHGKC